MEIVGKCFPSWAAQVSVLGIEKFPDWEGCGDSSIQT